MPEPSPSDPDQPGDPARLVAPRRPAPRPCDLCVVAPGPIPTRVWSDTAGPSRAHWPDPWTADAARAPLHRAINHWPGGRVATPEDWGHSIVIATDSEECVRSGRWSSTAALVNRAREGDREAFGLLVEQFQRTVYSVALSRLGNPSEAMELTQEVFLHVMSRLDQLREPERFAGWLRQVTVRMAINRATRRVPPSCLEDEVLEGAAAHRDEPIDELIARERARRLWEAMNQLKPLDREALVAFYIRSLSLVEIADELAVPVGTVKRRLHTARKRLKAQLRADSADPEEWTDAPNNLDEDQELPAEPLLAAC